MALVLDVQFNQATIPWLQLRERALAAETAGYGAIWVFDHLAGSSLRGDTMLEAFTLLGALATTTRTIELGTMVANVHNRAPAVLAVAAASVAAIAGRQVHLGLGAGAAPASRWSAEMRAVGQSVPATAAERHRRVAETLDVLHRVFGDEREPALGTFPLPRPRPNLLVGVSGPALAELAGARADGVNVGWHHPHRDELLAAAVAARGARGGFTLTTWITWAPELRDPDDPTRRAMAARELDRVVLVVPATVTVADLAVAL